MRVTALGGSVTAGGQGSVVQEQTYLGRVHAWLLSLGEEDRPVNLTVSPFVTHVALLPCRHCVGTMHARMHAIAAICQVPC